MVIEPSSKNIVPFTIRQHTREGDFYGFGLDSNERFLLPDGTVCHNSTLMKSVGVAIVMGQCGMFVPCASMRWTPMTALFTKIGSRDNIWKGRSTFITEMNELKHIMDRSDHRSLVLCDELTSGTETFSATGIVASTLETFLEKRSKFIMTTHLHTLQQFPTLLSHPQLRVMHFGMEHNRDKKTLVFDRVLREGSGKSIYGLEIAEHLGFSPLFLKRAFQYRSGLDHSATPLEPKKKSRYNAKKWVDRCEQCGSTTNLHTHHIQPQKDATPDGYIGVYHKNKLSNLRVLCHPCHEKEHHP
jgi:DNA mismatch repair protein MutS